MLYKGYFYDLNNSKYTVELITNRNSGATRNITLGVPPFVTEMEESDDNLFKPCKYQSATLKIVTDSATDYKFDAYSQSPNQTPVKLIDGNANIKWVGFVSPNLYNVGFTRENEELEIECIDALSILQYYKYKAATKEILSFADILLTKIFPQCELYSKVYVSESVHMGESSAATPILNDLYISENNFFDDKSYNQTDDDVAWTCQEVLEQICQFLGYTCVADCDNIYLLDYEDIYYGSNQFAVYEVGNTTPIEVNKVLSKNLNISESDYKGGDNTLSMTSCYNHLKIKDSFHTFDSIIPSVYDGLVNITSSADTELSASTNVRNGMYGEVVPNGVVGNTEGDENKNMICLVDKVYDPTSESYTTPNAIFVKYFKSPNYKTFAYEVSSSTSSHFSKLVPVDITELNYTDTKTYYGAVVCKFDVERLEQDMSNVIVVDEHGEIVTGVTVPIDVWLGQNNISSINFNNYIALFNPNNDHHITNESADKFPFLQSTYGDSASFFGGDNAYLIIKGNYIWHYFNDDPYPIPSSEDIDITEGRYYMDKETCYLLAKLKWGEKYWNGTDWVSGETTFQIPYCEVYSDNSDRRADATIFRDLPIQNTVSWRVGTTEKGYSIKVPEVIAGKPQLTLYKPIDPNYHSYRTGSNEGRHYKHSVVFLKDFDVKAVIGDPTFSDVNDTDTVYEVSITNGIYQSPTDFGDIEYKICTHDNKNPNYSAVAYKDENGKFRYLGKYISLRRSEFWDVMENQFIAKFTNQYTAPNVKLTLQLNNEVVPYQTFHCRWLSNVPRMVVDCQSIDYYNNVTTITMVQKR